MEKTIVTLCGADGCCPAVEVGKDDVKIGEEGNLCVLKPEEWEDLRQKILSGVL